MRYMGKMMMIALLVMVGQMGVAADGDNSSSATSGVTTGNNSRIAALCEAESNIPNVEAVAEGELAHECKAIDKCGREFRATGICYDHAYGAALARCKNETHDDPYSCYISSCWKVCR
jgi:hypothetical protein